MTFSLSFIPTVAFPTLATIQKTTAELLECWQQWSDETFGGQYRDAAETLICGLVLLIGCTVIRLYDYSKHCLGEALGYWLSEAEQQFVVESGLWLAQLPFKLLPVVECFDECWHELARSVVAEGQIFDDELSFCAAAMQ